MQGTVVLGTGEPSPIMKRSPSMRMIKDSKGDKSFSSFDLSSLDSNRTRRNSIPSPGSGGRESRGSVPVLLGLPVYTLGVINKTQSQGSKYRSFKSYLRGLGEQGSSSSNNDLSKLDETLARIKNQLDNMSAETQSVGKRVSILTEHITILSKKIPTPITPTEENTSESEKAKYLTIPANTNSWNTNATKYNSLPTNLLPIERAYSQPPPLLQINDVWEALVGARADESSDTDSDNNLKGSQEDFEVKVIHSSRLDNHHMIMVSSPLHSDDDEEVFDGLFSPPT